MSLQVGRVGLDVDMGQPSSWSQTGNEIQVGGWLRAGTLEQARALRQQLLGYVDSPTWEAEVPVVWDLDPTVDGWYRVLDVRVQDVLGVSQRRNLYQFSLTLERVAKYGAVKAESTLRGALRSNEHAITSNSASAWHAVPAAAVGYAIYGGGVTGVSYRSGVGGDLAVYQSNALWDAEATYRLAADRWYDHAARFADGAATYVGEQTDHPSSWLIETGRTQLVYTGQWVLRTVHSGLYSGAAPCTPGYQSGAGFVPFTVTGSTPLRNSPVETIVRFELSDPGVSSTDPPASATLDVAARRGAQFLEWTFQGVGVERMWAVNLAGTVAGLSTGGSVWGAVRNVPFAGDAHAFVLSPQKVGTTSQWCHMSTARPSGEFAVGWTATSTASSLNARLAEYIGPVYENLRVVSP